MWKHGMHIHLPDLVVGGGAALALHADIVSRASARTDWGEAALDWGTILDSHVYAPTGSLRIIGAPKVKRCDEPLRGQGGQGGQGSWVFDPHFYWPEFVFAGREMDEKKTRLVVYRPMDGVGHEDRFLKEAFRLTTV